jgi:ATP-binding cassette, subfamily B, bacterial MsbA
VLLGFLGQSADINAGLPIIKAIASPFRGITGDSPEAQLFIMTGVILFTLLLKNLANYSNALVSGALRRGISNDLREDGLKLLLDVDIDYFVKTSIGEMTNCLNHEISRAASAIATLSRIVTLMISTLVFVGLLVWFSWQLTIISTILMAVVACLNQFNINRSKAYGKEFSRLSKAYSSSMLDVLTGMRLIRSKATETTELDRIRGYIEDREQAEFQNQANSAIIEPISEMSGMIALLLIVIIGRKFIGNPVQTDSFNLLSYLFLLFRTLPLVAQLNSARNGLANILPSIDITRHFLDRHNKAFMSNGTSRFQGLQEGIHFHHISLTYPGHTKQVLKDVTLYLPRNTTLALVGSSGSGKSTLADLLPRFYDPTDGCVLIDGMDIRALDFRSFRRSMGIVSQDTFLFNASIRDNIAYGCAEATDDDVIAAAQQANAFEFISQLPQGFETEIGDRGVLLSGGQRQRLAIARALLQNPEILILDEATSALDTVSERLVQQAIDNLSRNRTTLVIAHRLSTVQKADQIAVMDQGQVVEVGTHEELITKGGFYSRLCELQLHDNNGSTESNSSMDREQLAAVSYDVRTRLNQVIGSLGLMVDNLTDHPEEEKEWMQEAYYSALDLMRSLEQVEKDATNHAGVTK